MIVHIVMFKFKDENKKQNLLEVKKRLIALKSEIKEIQELEVGIDFMQSERSYDLSLYTKFKTKDDLKTYATDPKHLEVIELIKSVATDIKAVDYTIE